MFSSSLPFLQLNSRLSFSVVFKAKFVEEIEDSISCWIVQIQAIVHSEQVVEYLKHACYTIDCVTQPITYNNDHAFDFGLSGITQFNEHGCHRNDEFIAFQNC